MAFLVKQVILDEKPRPLGLTGFTDADGFGGPIDADGAVVNVTIEAGNVDVADRVARNLPILQPMANLGLDRHGCHSDGHSPDSGQIS